MEKFRIKNDLSIFWSITEKDGSPYTLSDKTVRLYVTGPRGRMDVTSDITVQDNVICWLFRGSRQRYLGTYKITVEIQASPADRTIRKDIPEAFELVSSSQYEQTEIGRPDINEEGELTLATSLDIFQIKPIIPQVGPNRNWWVDGADTGKSSVGLTAYEFAKEQGYEGTEEEYAAECLAVPVLNEESRTATAESEQATKQSIAQQEEVSIYMKDVAEPTIARAQQAAAKAEQAITSIPKKTSQLVNDSGFITKEGVPASDWNASTYKEGHIKNRTHHMQDHLCHYFKGSPIKISKPSGVGYVLLTYDTDLADKFIRIEISADESKTHEFLDAMGMPLIFRWDADNSTINVESFMGAVETYGMRAYYSSSAKGFKDYFTKLDKGFMPKEVITNENASFMDNSSPIILPFGIKSGDFKTYSVDGDGKSILGQRKVDLGEINDSRENVIVATWYYAESWGRGLTEYGEFTIDELKEKNKYGEEYHWLREGEGFVGVKVDENNHLWAFLSGSDANSWTIQCNAYSEKTRMDSSWIKHNGEGLNAKLTELSKKYFGPILEGISQEDIVWDRSTGKATIDMDGLGLTHIEYPTFTNDGDVFYKVVSLAELRANPQLDLEANESGGHGDVYYSESEGIITLTLEGTPKIYDYPWKAVVRNYGVVPLSDAFLPESAVKKSDLVEYVKYTGLGDFEAEVVDPKLAQKQDKLVSGKTIKTINGQSLIGEGNIEISGGSTSQTQEYAPLKYLENTGTQYIDTGLVLTQDDVITLDFEVPDSAASLSTDKILIDARDDNYGVRVSTWGDNKKWYARFGHNSGATSAAQSAAIRKGSLTFSKSSLVVNGSTVISSLTFTAMPTGTLKLFSGVTPAGAISAPSYARISSCKVARGSETILNLIPVQRTADGVLGMRDLASGNFLTNAGTGTFGYELAPVAGEVTVKKYPSLTDEQKAAMQALMDDYYNNRGTFYYEFTHNRNAFTSGSQCYDSARGKFKQCCATFVQHLMMGRSINDFLGKTASTYSSKITKTDVSKFGYYFDFKYRKYLYGLTDTDENGETTYHGYVQPNADNFEGSYSYNSYYHPDSSRAKKQNFNGFCNANDMARELYEMGCEIPFSELEIGDIIFTYDNDLADNSSMFNFVAWRNIYHVGMVYDVKQIDASSKEIYYIECTSYFDTETRPIEKPFLSSSQMDLRFKAFKLTEDMAFCARMPIAFGYEPNVPDQITSSPTP